MSLISAQLVYVYPEISLLIFACLILVVGVFIKPSKIEFVYWATQVAFIISFLLLILKSGVAESTILNDMFVLDSLAAVLKAIILFVAFIVLLYSRQYLKNIGIFKVEFFVLTLFATLGAMVLVSSNHLIVLYLGLELLSLSLYSLVALHRDSSTASESAIKYFVLGVIASGILLFGMSLLYGISGTLI